MAIAITTMVSWASNYVTSSWFLQLTDGPFGTIFVFAIMGISCLGAFGFTYRYVPETKDRSVDDCVNMVMYARYQPFTGDGGDDQPEIEDEEEAMNGALLDKRPPKSTKKTIQMTE